MVNTLNKARSLRKQQTEAEMLLWQQLRSRKLDGYKFRRQYIVEHYIVDFVCTAEKLVIELDGQHHAEPEQRAYDDARTQFLQACGYQILRFWNTDITTNMTATLKMIRSALSPRPIEGEGPGVRVETQDDQYE